MNAKGAERSFGSAGQSRMMSFDESPRGKSHDRRDQLWGVVSPRQTSKIACVNVCTVGSEEEGSAELAIRTV